VVIYKPVKTDELVRMITLVMNRNAETSNQKSVGSNQSASLR